MRNWPHYANEAYDIKFAFPFGVDEIEGIHSRTDFDLKAHQETSGKNLQYVDQVKREKFLPYVIETSVGLDRTILALLCNAYRVENPGDKEKERVVMGICPLLSTNQSCSHAINEET